MVQPLGVHYLLELRGCNPTVINDLPEVRRILIEAAKQAKATVLDARFHQFSPQGVSGVVVVGESHLSIHTWPEYGYASADIYTCGHTDPLRAAFYIVEALQAKSVYCMIIGRGEHPVMSDESEPPSPFIPARWGLQPPTDWLFVDYVNPSAATLLRVKCSPLVPFGLPADRRPGDGGLRSLPHPGWPRPIGGSGRVHLP
jgi:S-adenosylmethionine decarboxylase